MGSLRVRTSVSAESLFPSAPINLGNDQPNNRMAVKSGDERTRASLDSAAKKISTGNEPKEIFWVKKNTDSKKLSENLLREHFGFETADIELYKARYKELFRLTTARRVRLKPKKEKIALGQRKVRFPNGDRMRKAKFRFR